MATEWPRARCLVPIGVPAGHTAYCGFFRTRSYPGERVDRRIEIVRVRTGIDHAGKYRPTACPLARCMVARAN